MSTPFTDEGGYSYTPLIRDEDIHRLASEMKRRVLAWLFRSSKPDSSSVASNKTDASNTATGAQMTEVWVTKKDAELRTLLSDLAALIQRGDYDEDFVKPTEYAWKKTWELLDTAGKNIDGAFPLGTVYPHGNGGLRIEWIGSEKELRLSISANANGRSYIYHEVGNQYDADYNVSAYNLANWILWFNRNGRGTR